MCLLLRWMCVCLLLRWMMGVLLFRWMLCVFTVEMEVDAVCVYH